MKGDGKVAQKVKEAAQDVIEAVKRRDNGMKGFREFEVPSVPDEELRARCVLAS